MNLSELRTFTRSLIDEPTTNFYSNSEIDRAINNAQQELWSLILSTNSEWLKKKTDFSVLKNTIEYTPSSLYSDFHRFIRIEDDEWKTLQYLPYALLYKYKDLSDKPYFYTSEGNILYLIPKPDKAYTFKIVYIYKYSDLTDTSPNTLLPSPYHKLLGYEAAIELALKDELLRTDILTRHQEAKQRFINDLSGSPVPSDKRIKLIDRL